MNEIYILDSTESIMFTVKVKEDHMVLMCKRGWVQSNDWLFKDKTVNVMSHIYLEEFIKEAG